MDNNNKIFDKVLIDSIIKKLRHIEFTLHIVKREINKINDKIDKINNSTIRW